MMLNLFKRKKKYELPDEWKKFLRAEETLRKEGWISWCCFPPHGLDAVYAKRTLDQTIQVLYPKKLHPMFNIANLWWMPHRHEIEIINPKLIN